MGRHSSIGPHYYKGLDEGEHAHNVRIELTMRELAERIDAQNYGTQRFLSHLADVRLERLRQKIKEYEAKGDEDIALMLRREGDPLIEEILRMLKAGYY